MVIGDTCPGEQFHEVTGTELGVPTGRYGFLVPLHGEDE